MKLFHVHRRNKNAIFKHCLQPLAAIGVILKFLEQVKTFIRGFLFKFRFPSSYHLKIQASKNEEREGGKEGRRGGGKEGRRGEEEEEGRRGHCILASQYQASQQEKGWSQRGSLCHRLTATQKVWDSMAPTGTLSNKD